jgi:quercetin dioxygenase-like cupin family protein
MARERVKGRCEGARQAACVSEPRHRGSNPCLPANPSHSQETTCTGRTVAASEALPVRALISPAGQKLASRALAKTRGGNLTLLAFDGVQGLTQRTSLFDALVMVFKGARTLTIGGTPVHAMPGTIVGMPAAVPHALDEPTPTRRMLLMLRELKET